MKINLIENYIHQHKVHGFHVNFKGWQLHKWNYYAYTKDCYTKYSIYYGVKHVEFIDITPCGEVQCAGCNKMFPLSSKMFGNTHGDLIHCIQCTVNLTDNIKFERALRHHSWLDIDAFNKLQICKIICTSWSNRDEALHHATVYTQDMHSCFKTYGKDTSCMILPDGILPSTLRERFIARRVLKRWRDSITKKKVAYVLYKCIPNIDYTTARALAMCSVR
jgi:hypothetical protein